MARFNVTLVRRTRQVLSVGQRLTFAVEADDEAQARQAVGRMLEGDVGDFTEEEWDETGNHILSEGTLDPPAIAGIEEESGPDGGGARVVAAQVLARAE